MSRLNNVIEEVKMVRQGDNRGWIFTDNGKVSDDVLVIDTISILEDLKEYELNISDEALNNFTDDESNNTYNYGGRISNDLNYEWKELEDHSILMRIMVHLSGDVRCNYSDYFMVKFDDWYQFFELEHATESKMLNDRYCADLSMFTDTYEVYDYKLDKFVDETFCELEKESVLEMIKGIDN